MSSRELTFVLLAVLFEDIEEFFALEEVVIELDELVLVDHLLAVLLHRPVRVHLVEDLRDLLLRQVDVQLEETAKIMDAIEV